MLFIFYKIPFKSFPRCKVVSLKQFLVPILSFSVWGAVSAQRQLFNCIPLFKRLNFEELLVQYATMLCSCGFVGVEIHPRNLFSEKRKLKLNFFILISDPAIILIK